MYELLSDQRTIADCFLDGNLAVMGMSQVSPCFKLNSTLSSYAQQLSKQPSIEV